MCFTPHVWLLFYTHWTSSADWLPAAASTPALDTVLHTALQDLLTWVLGGAFGFSPHCLNPACLPYPHPKPTNPGHTQAHALNLWGADLLTCCAQHAA